jgi:hypothetical protein
MEHFSDFSTFDTPAQRQAVRAQILKNVDEPIIGLMVVNGHDLAIFSGTNKGFIPEDHDRYEVEDTSGGRTWVHSTTEDMTIAGRQEITSYVARQLSSHCIDRSSPMELTSLVSILTAAKQVSCLPDSLDYDTALVTLWQAIQHLAISSYSIQEMADLALTCTESDLAPYLETYVRAEAAKATSIKMLYSNPLVSAYITAQQGIRPRLDSEVALLSVICGLTPLDT